MGADLRFRLLGWASAVEMEGKWDWRIWREEHGVGIRVVIVESGSCSVEMLWMGYWEYDSAGRLKWAMRPLAVRAPKVREAKGGGRSSKAGVGGALLRWTAEGGWRRIWPSCRALP